MDSGDPKEVVMWDFRVTAEFRPPPGTRAIIGVNGIPRDALEATGASFVPVLVGERLFWLVYCPNGIEFRGKVEPSGHYLLPRSGE